MFRTQTFYAPEMGRDITVRGLSAAGVFRLHSVKHRNLPDGAEQIAVMGEHLRDGMVEPRLETVSEILAFIEKYPELAVRIFAAVRHLTEGAHG